jgi:hypothetical protein
LLCRDFGVEPAFDGAPEVDRAQPALPDRLAEAG